MDISKWFYRPHYTTPELDKKIEDVEKALGFKLFIWQKNIYRTWRFQTIRGNNRKNIEVAYNTGGNSEFHRATKGIKRKNF